jgi:hypothetical protein
MTTSPYLSKHIETTYVGLMQICGYNWQLLLFDPFGFTYHDSILYI